MRLAFFLLTLLLIVVVGWATWIEAHPQWARYQHTLRERSEARILVELEAAELELQRPESIATLVAIDALLLELEDSDEARRNQILEGDLTTVQSQMRQLRIKLRQEEARFAERGASEKHRARLALLEQAEDVFASESGRWPPDDIALAEARSHRDSLRAVVAVVLGPVDSLVAELDSLRSTGLKLRNERSHLTAGRDSLLTEKARLLSVVSVAQATLRRLRAAPPGIREIVSADGSEVARCPTCHGGLGDRPPTHPVLPAAEAFVDVPCTVCHRGNGRALDVKRAHFGLLVAAGRGAGKYSLQGRIDRLRTEEPSARREAMEELRRITGIDPPAVETAETDIEAVEALAWLAWWEVARRYFESTEISTSATAPTSVVDFDRVLYSTAGRPLRYVGSRVCLGCHHTSHREHSERWLATKFKSLDRLRDVADPRSCYRCHVTGYDAATGQFAEAGVTCEACHGPGEIYSEMMFAGAELNGRGQTGRGRELLDLSARLARDAASARMVEGDAGPISLCVSCHHPRRHLEGGPSILERNVETRAAVPDSLSYPLSGSLYDLVGDAK